MRDLVLNARLEEGNTRACAPCPTQRRFRAGEQRLRISTVIRKHGNADLGRQSDLSGFNLERFREAGFENLLGTYRHSGRIARIEKECGEFIA